MPSIQGVAAATLDMSLELGSTLLLMTALAAACATVNLLPIALEAVTGQSRLT